MEIRSALEDELIDVEGEGWFLYEHSSQFDCEVRAFTSVDDVKALLRSDEESYHFELYSPEMGGSVQFRRITLNPDAVPGKSFRYATEGWGLIQFYVHQARNGKLRPCHTNHFTEMGAGKWAPARTEVPPVDEWNWRHVTSMSSRLNRHIRSLAVAKHGSRPILAGAHAALSSGQISFLG